MKIRILSGIFTIICLVAVIAGCKQLSENEKFELKLKDAIAASETKESPVDSVKILNVDTLSRTQYAGLILEQLENMAFECGLVYEAGRDSLPEAELRELELTMAEIRDACDFYRDKYENGAGGEEDSIFIFFVDAELFRDGEAFNYFYLITPDFVVHDDPFGDNLLE
ncbi:MAG: hypothetical protein J5862_00440 [Bacteroidales bacterium]|nr:hypothetical protein [Bacteroidales bacterium]